MNEIQADPRPQKKSGDQSEIIARQELRETKEQLKRQYLSLAQVNKGMWEILEEHPETKPDEVLAKVLPAEVKNSLSDERITRAEEMITEYTLDQNDLKGALGYYETLPGGLANKMYEQYTDSKRKESKRLDLEGIDEKLSIHKGILVLQVDPDSFDRIDYVVTRGNEIKNGKQVPKIGDGGIMVDTIHGDASYPDTVQSLVKKLALTTLSYTDAQLDKLTAHEGGHKKNKSRFPEYAESQGTQVKYKDELMLKEEILAGLEEGESIFDMGNRLYDLYNPYNILIKREIERQVENAYDFASLSGKERKGAIEHGKETLENFKIKRERYKEKLIRMLGQTEQIMRDHGELGCELLAATPARRRWRLFAENPQLDGLKHVKFRFAEYDRDTDEYMTEDQDGDSSSSAEW